MQDEDQQTQEVFDALTGQQMASAPPRVEDRPERMTLESVPGYDRPMSSNPDDRIVGQDELGRRVYETVTGQRYTISRNPDQRTTRTRVQEAVSEFAENPRLPTAREALGFAGDVVQGAYESAAGAVRGTGTIGDVAGLAVGSGAGSMLGEVPEGALRSFGGATSNRVTNPLFRPSTRPTDFPDDRDGRILLEYYSPLVSAVEQMPIAREGSTGQNIMAYLNKRAPNVSSQELNYALPSLEPNTRYTRGEVMELLRPSTRDGFRAVILESNSPSSSQELRYGGTQRQNLRSDEEEEYFEILLETPGPEVDYPSHHNPETLAHSRSSIRVGEDGRYLLIEELQSDALQNVNRGTNQIPDDSGALIDAYFDEITEETPIEVVSMAVSDIYNPVQGETFEETRQRIRDFYENYGVSVNGGNVRALHQDGIRQLTLGYNEDPSGYDGEFERFFDDVETAATNRAEAGFTAGYGEGDIPFSTTQYIRDLLLANFAKAREEGIDRVVLPSVEEIARQRGGFESLEAAVRALRPTYGDSVRKAINTINAETQGQVRIGSYPLSYWDLTQPESTRRSNGLLLDISGLDFEPQTQAVRFAEGGMVDMERQMDLFEQGGLTDDGAMRDPVSGNEVPPGSMATEVRDDMPAMLSEGEYIVPADVVRFFGVKFFEDLRSQAKSGLSQMDRDGRIGGDPVGMNQDDLTPEELQMLAEISGMYAGGMMQKGYQEGGMVTAPSNYTVPGASLFGPSAGFQGVNTVTLYGPNCETTSVTMPTDQQIYNSLLAQGYSTTQPEHCRTPNQQQPQYQPSGYTPTRDDGGNFNNPPTGSGTSADRTPRTMDMDEFNAMREDPVAFGMAALEGRDYTRVGAGVGTMLAGPAGMLIGGGLGVANQLTRLSRANAALEIARATGADTTELEAQIEEFVGDLPNAARIALELGAASGSRILERYNQTLQQLDPATAQAPTATTAAPAPVTATPLPSTPTQAPQVQPVEVQPTGSVDTEYQGEQVTGDRILTERDIQTLNSAGVGVDAMPGDRATKREQDFLETRETQTRSFMGPDTAQTRADRAAAMRPAFPSAEAGATTQEVLEGIRGGQGEYLVVTSDNDLRAARPGEMIRDIETGDMVTVPEVLPPAPQVPTQAPTSAQAGLRGGQLAADRPYVDTPQIEFGTVRHTVSRAPTIPPMPGVAPFASTRPHTPPPLVPNQTQYNPMTGRFEYYDTNYTPAPQAEPLYSWQQPGFQPTQAYQEAYNRLATGQNTVGMTGRTDLTGLSREELLPPPSSDFSVTREKGQTSIVSRPAKDDGGTTFSPSKPSRSTSSTTKDDGGTNFSPSKSTSSTSRTTKDDGGTNFSPSKSSSSSKPSSSSSSTSSRQQAEQAAKDLGVGLATGGRNKGGLVSKPKKKRVAKKK